MPRWSASPRRCRCQAVMRTSRARVPGVRKVFGRFDIETVETTYTVASGASAKKDGEVLISG